MEINGVSHGTSSPGDSAVIRLSKMEQAALVMPNSLLCIQSSKQV